MRTIADVDPIAAVRDIPAFEGAPRARMDAVARIAAAHAEAVDQEGRFPAETFEALKAARLLGVMVPVHLGGEGLGLGQTADLCFALGRACSSSALIFAMHQVKAACLVRHHGHSPWQLDFLRRLAREQLLLGSSTTEGNAGGAVRKSSAPIEPTPQGFHLMRAATVVSYGEQADAIVTTARRSAEAVESDQVLAVVLKQDYRLERMGRWNAMGMRGTCSHAFALEATGQADQILPVPYAEIHARTMTASAHVLWGAVWAGIAAAAVERARLYLRKAARGAPGGAAPGASPPGAPHLAEAKAGLQTLCTLIAGFTERHERIMDQPSAVEALDHQTAISLLKVQASELAVSVVMQALRTCGLSGYRNDGETSVSQYLRDVLSAPLMISNDRILADVKTAALMDRGPTSIFGDAS